MSIELPVDHKAQADAEVMIRNYKTERELRERFSGLLRAGKVTFDWNGHHSRRKTKPVFPPAYIYEFRDKFGYEESFGDILYTLFAHLDDADVELFRKVCDKPGSSWFTFHEEIIISCFECGQFRMGFKFDGQTVKATTRCKYPDGLPPIKAVINVPSGKLVAANYFQDAVAPNVERFVGSLGYKHETEHYAKQNVGYGACGNSCPTIYANETNDKFIVGNPAYTEKMDSIPNPFPGYRRVNGVVTDLWAWSIADKKTAEKLDGKVDKNDVFDAVPGRYRVTQLFHRIDGDNLRIPRKFATLELIKGRKK